MMLPRFCGLTPSRKQTAPWISAFCVVLLLFLLIEAAVASPLASASTRVHGTPEAQVCPEGNFSPDGNPFALCPGPYLTGGNCVWWAWEQWHWLGYDLPANWGNAADWVLDAELAGLPIGTTPRVGAIAVFPIDDGVWANTSAGHVAFVTAVSADGMHFDVTYENYGDATPMLVGRNYVVNVINQARYQNGQLRFIYFPRLIDPQRFALLPGIAGTDAQAIQQSNTQLLASATQTGSGPTDFGGSTIAPGLTHTASEQELNADFTGTGVSDLLLYNRLQGDLAVLHLQHGSPAQPTAPGPILVSLGDTINPAGSWGSSLDVHVGDFAGDGKSDILLYDRLSGQLHLISLTPQLTIQKHVILSGLGPGWSMAIGRFDGVQSEVFLYQRYNSSNTPAAQVGATSAGSAGGAANVLVLAFNSDFSLRQQHAYRFTPANWELYVGTFASAKQDGIFLYDRTAGEGQIMSFDQNVNIVQYHQLHHLAGNWLVASGDLSSAGRSQLVMYDPGNGNAQILSFTPTLDLASVKSYTNWGTNQLLFTGHFGLPTYNVMLYDPAAGESRFLTFDASLQVIHQYITSSWDSNWQLLSSSFIDRADHSNCGGSTNCSPAQQEHLLVLQRQMGQLLQYTFALGSTSGTYDNRTRLFERLGISSADQSLQKLDGSDLNLVMTLKTDIRDEELY